MSGEKIKEDFYCLLHEYREKTRLTQFEFGHQISNYLNGSTCSRDKIAKLEAGKTRMERDLLIAIIIVFYNNKIFTNREEIDHFLDIGKFGRLDAEELSRINPNWTEKTESDAKKPEYQKTPASTPKAVSNSQIVIPFLTLAMNFSEAKDLFFNPDFQPMYSGKLNQFTEFIRSLAQTEEDIQYRYSDSRDKWIPYDSQDERQTIKEIITNLLNQINRDQETKKQPHIIADFYTNSFFNDETEKIDYLYEKGGIIIADIPSLFHPIVFNIFDKSAIRNRKEKIAMLMISPEKSHKTPINNFISDFLKLNFKWNYEQYQNNLLRLYEFDIADLNSLRKRLFSILPDTMRIVQDEQPNPETLVSLTRFQKTRFGENYFREIK
jgi:hypothetical protein